MPDEITGRTAVAKKIMVENYGLYDERTALEAVSRAAGDLNIFAKMAALPITITVTLNSPEVLDGYRKTGE